MIVVVIAGGSGSRLWPMSTPDYPKHLLRIDGDELSLMQRAYERARKLTDADKVHVITEISHAHHVKEQLPEVPEDNFVIEPARRSTNGCVLAALRIAHQKYDENEPLAILWADHYIRDIEGFAHSFRSAGKASAEHGRVVLVGIEPTYPSTGFGYIKKADKISEEPYVYSVENFKEKPNFDTAKEYLQSGNYLWNGGYLVGTPKSFVDAMQTYSPDMYAQYQSLTTASSEEEYTERYLALESVAVDYSFNEKVANFLVVPASFDWMDLGSFKDMYDAAEHDEAGNHVHGNVEIEEVENAFVQNSEDKPIAVIGLDNIVVVNTEHGLVVARKDLSQKVGDVSKRFKQ